MSEGKAEFLTRKTPTPYPALNAPPERTQP